MSRHPTIRLFAVYYTHVLFKRLQFNLRKKYSRIIQNKLLTHVRITI